MAKKSPVTKVIGKSTMKMSGSIGGISFLFGASIAVLIGVIQTNSEVYATLTSLLILLGIIVGFLNVSTKETGPFLMSTVSLIIVAALGGAVLGQVAQIGAFLEGILTSILSFVIPAAIIVALKTIYLLERS